MEGEGSSSSESLSPPATARSSSSSIPSPPSTASSTCSTRLLSCSTGRSSYRSPPPTPFPRRSSLSCRGQRPPTPYTTRSSSSSLPSPPSTTRSSTSSVPSPSSTARTIRSSSSSREQTPATASSLRSSSSSLPSPPPTASTIRSSSSSRAPARVTTTSNRSPCRSRGIPGRTQFPRCSSPPPHYCYSTSATSTDSESEENVESPNDPGGHTSSSSSSSEDISNLYGPIMIWVKDKPFEFGTIPVYHSSKISLPILTKMVAYCRQRGWSETLPLGSWYHICRTKLRLNYHTGWLYIRLFNILFQQMDRICGDLDENGKWDERCNWLKSKKYDRNGEFEVPTLQFVLFLYLQHSYRMMSNHGPPLPSAIYSEGSSPLEEPQFSDSSDDEFDESGIEKEEKKIIDENLQLRFMSKHLEVIIALLETGLKEVNSARLDLEIVDVLDLLLCSARDEDITADTMTLKEVIMGGEYGGYDALSHSVDRQLFIRWVKTSLRVNPYGASSGYLKSTIPGLVTGVIDEFHFVHARRENRIMCNESTAPVCWYTISHVGKQVLFLKDIPIQADIRLYKCTYSFIYLIGCFSCVAIEWCQECTIFLGCVSGVLRLTGCQGLRVVGVARQIIINETTMSVFHVHTSCSPLLAGDSITQLYFGPYNSFYAHLQLDMRLAKIGSVLSMWDKVRALSFDGRPVDCEHRWTRIEGKALQEFNFPFYVAGSTTHNPIQLQARHTWALEKKRRALNKWTSDVIILEDSDLALDPLQSQLFLQILLQRFTKFLLESNCQYEIAGLVSYNETSRPGRVRDSSWFANMPETLADVARNLIYVMEKNKRKKFQERDEKDVDGTEDTTVVPRLHLDESAGENSDVTNTNED